MIIRKCDWCVEEPSESNALVDVRIEYTEEICEKCREELIKFIKPFKKNIKKENKRKLDLINKFKEELDKERKE